MSDSSDVMETIAETVAESENVSSRDLPLLAEGIDSETYHQLTATGSRPTETPRSSYLRYQVAVRPNGEVIVTRRE